MKKTSLLFSIIVLTAFTINKKTHFDLSHFKKDFVKIKNEFYVSKYETTNSEYRSFLSDLLNNNQTELYKNSLPDTLCWRDKLTYNEPFVDYYFRSPSFDNYPVVGITYESANEYCSWLTKNYNKDPKRKFKKVTFTLLSKEEWIFAANKGDTTKAYTWGTGFIQNNRKKDLCNYRRIEYKYDSLTKKYQEIESTPAKKILERRAIAASVNSYFPNSFGIYNMCGNVAEMINEKGIAKGGSYDDPAYQVMISSEKKYSKPTADIGFRVAMKVMEE